MPTDKPSAHSPADNSHFVQFFESASALSEAVSRFVAGGMSEGAGTVVIATPEHVAAVEAALAEREVDVAGAKSSGQLIFLDAESTLQSLLRDGMPDRELFNQVIGGVIDRLSTRFSKVYAYGEMVGILWARKNAAGTVALENLWNDLASTRPFTLFCGYSMQAFSRAEDAQAFSEICRTHSHVLPSQGLQALNSRESQLRAIALLEQQTATLASELVRRRKAEAELRDFFENSVVALHWVGPDGKILRANRAELELLGYSEKEYVGHHIADFHADSDAIQDILGCLSRGEPIHAYPARLRRKDGSIRHVLIDSNVYFEDGKFIHTRCFTRDVTDQIAAQARIHDLESRKQEEKFRLLVENVKDYAIFMLSPEGLITTWNEGAHRIKQYEESEIVGQHFSRFYTPEDIARHHPEAELKIAEAQGRYEEEGWRVRKDGSRFWANVVITALRDQAGKLVGFAKVTRDLTERKKAEEERLERLREATVQAQIKENEETLDQIFALSPAFMALLSVPDYRYLKANAQHLRVTQSQDIIGKRMNEVVPDAEAQGLIGLLNEVVRSGRPFIGKEAPILFGRGENARTRYLDFVYQPLKRPNGEVFAISVQGTDMTDAVLAKKKLAELLEQTRQSEEQLRILANSMPQIAWMSNPNGHTFWYNRRWYEFTGFAPGSIDDAAAHSILHPDFAQEVRQRSAHSLQTGAPFEMEIPMRSADGKYRWFLSRMEPLRDNHGKILRWFGTSTDIDESRRIRETNQMLADASALFSQSLNYEETLKSLAAIIVARLADWCSISLIEPGKEPREAAVAHPDPERLKLAQELFKDYPTDWQAKTGVPQVIRTGKSELYPDIPDELLELAARDKRHLELIRGLKMRSVMIVPLKARGKVLGAITFIASDSGRQYTEHDLALAEELGSRAGVAVDNGILYEEAQKAISARDEFLSIASHELKTPLTSLKLQSQLRAREIERGDMKRFSPEKLPKLLSDDVRQVNRLTRLVDEMLDVSRLQSGKMSYTLEEFDLNDLVRDLLARFSPQVEGTRSEISFSSGGPAVGRWDRMRIEQVLVNLLTNALKYGAHSTIEVRVSTEGDFAELSVTDRGIGIRLEDQDRIFGQFERAISASSISGLGLGLYISRRIVEAHNGRISVRSEPGKGSTFVVALPLKAADRSGLQVGRTSEPSVSRTGGES